MTSLITPSSNPSTSAELAFFTGHVHLLSQARPAFSDDQQWNVDDLPLKGVRPVQVAVHPPPRFRHELPSASTSTSGAASQTSATLSAPISVTVKSIKPSRTFSLSIHPTDTVLDLKLALAKSDPSAPPADSQRLLSKGKALADSKLVKEYDLKDGTVLNLLIKPGAASATTAEPMSVDPTTTKPSEASPKAVRNVPDLVVTTDTSKPALALETHEDSLPRRADLSGVGRTSHAATSSLPAGVNVSQLQRGKLASVQFWQGLKSFLALQFGDGGGEEARAVWEDFFLSKKDLLSPSEIAFIRDQTGMAGMAGL